MKRVPFMKRVLQILGLVVLAPLLVLLFYSTLDHADLLERTNAWYGIDYLSPLWLGLAMILPVVLLFGGGWKRTAAAAAAVTILYLGMFGDFSLSVLLPKTPAVPDAAKIRVAALNVEYYANGLRTVLDSVRAMDADVVFLSENAVPDSLKSEARRIVAPMEFVMGHDNSTAILSKYPIVEFHEVELPSYEASLSGSNDIAEMSDHIHRSFTHAVLNVRGVHIHVLSVRLIAGRPKNNAVDEQLRWGRYLLDVQMKEVASFTRYVTHLSGPVIFGGDLNAPPSSKPIRKIRAYATDAYMETHIWGDCTFRTEAPAMRLDYLFCMNHVVPLAAVRPLLKVSDHFPVTAEFLLPVSFDTTAIGRRLAGL